MLCGRELSLGVAFEMVDISLASACCDSVGSGQALYRALGWAMH